MGMLGVQVNKICNCKYILLAVVDQTVTSSSLYKSEEPLVSVCNGQALLADDEKPKGSVGPATGS